MSVKQLGTQHAVLGKECPPCKACWRAVLSIRQPACWSHKELAVIAIERGPGLQHAVDVSHRGQHYIVAGAVQLVKHASAGNWQREFILSRCSQLTAL